MCSFSGRPLRAHTSSALNARAKFNTKRCRRSAVKKKGQLLFAELRGGLAQEAGGVDRWRSSCRTKCVRGPGFSFPASTPDPRILGRARADRRFLRAAYQSLICWRMGSGYISSPETSEGPFSAVSSQASKQAGKQASKQVRSVLFVFKLSQISQPDTRWKAL